MTPIPASQPCSKRLVQLSLLLIAAGCLEALRSETSEAGGLPSPAVNALSQSITGEALQPVPGVALQFLSRYLHGEFG